MTALLAIASIILLAVVVVQIGKLTELASKIRGEAEIQKVTNNRSAAGLIVFCVVFLIGTVWSAMYYKNYMLGYGPHEAASIHGKEIDSLFAITLFFTFVVFVITHIALFWFSYKYKGQEGRKALYMPHNNTLEVVWTAVPAIVMCFLVIRGLVAWNEITADIPEGAVAGQDYIEIEATGYQFAWAIRYPGADNKLGTKNFRLITGKNSVGQDWTDEKNLDDFMPNEIVLPKGKPIRVRITSRDVLHNFYLPHFRVKMDAVPGLPTYFVFTAEKTTEEYRQELRNYEEYQALNEDGDPLWKVFDFELACAELCGKGHYSMLKKVRIVEESEYNNWYNQQQSVYLTSIRGTNEDPYIDQLLDSEIQERSKEFNDAVTKALSAESPEDKIVTLPYVNFETGTSTLDKLSRYELDNVTDFLKKNPNVTIEVAGHTDNTGDNEGNIALSNSRAQRVFDYLVENGINRERLTPVGYGSARPIDTNDTDAGRAKNRRTEIQILTQ